jgi:heme a synthase
LHQFDPGCQAPLLFDRKNQSSAGQPEGDQTVMSTPPVDTVQNTNVATRDHPQGQVGQAVTAGFAMALVIWVTWFVSHLPWSGLSEQVRVGAVLAAWLAASAVLATSGTILSGLGSGLISALLGLLLLGSKLIETASDGPIAGPAKPNAAVIALGFLGLGGIMGLAGYLVSRLLPRPAHDAKPDWLARFAAVTAFTVAVLLFIGGLVTSTNSGMAVPDWPRTYGANMFLYPLTNAAADVFLEHSHRLFGTLVGLATITLLVWTFAREKRAWVKACAAIVLTLVITQGVIGGFRVTGKSQLLAMIHGVLGQLTFGMVVAMAAFLSPAFKRRGGTCQCGYSLDALPVVDERITCPECGTVTTAVVTPEGLVKPRRLRAMATGFLHATILQLIFGAAYRHFRDNHSLMSHIAMSVVVVLMAMMAGFSARTATGQYGGIGPILRRVGGMIIAVVGLQFILGWIAFLAAGRDAAAATAGQALIRTIHQANGALVLALAVLAFTWTRRLLRNQPAK